MKIDLELSEKDMPARNRLAARIVKGLDTRPNSEYREAAAAMDIGDAIPDLDDKAAGLLYRAIEEVHGERTATMRQTGGSCTVWRVSQRPQRKRNRQSKVTNA